MLTFEFPTKEKAMAFAERLGREIYTFSIAHRVVDVADADDPFDHDFLVLLARYHGATLPESKTPERLYILSMWASATAVAPPPDAPDDVAAMIVMQPDGAHNEITLTTLAEFFASNPDVAETIRAKHPDPTVPSGFRGGGGAQPLWTLQKTPFVGKREG